MVSAGVVVALIAIVIFFQSSGTSADAGSEGSSFQDIFTVIASDGSNSGSTEPSDECALLLILGAGAI